MCRACPGRHLSHRASPALRPREENGAHDYMPSPDGSLTDVGRRGIAAGSVQQAANAIKSTASDLLIYYKAVLSSLPSEALDQQHVHPGHALRGLRIQEEGKERRQSKGPGRLGSSSQGRATHTHRLQVFGTDALCWPLTESESRTRGCWPDLDLATVCVLLGVDGRGNVAKLRWAQNPDVFNGDLCQDKGRGTGSRRVVGQNRSQGIAETISSIHVTK